jgi:cell division protein FtsL
MAIRRTKSGSKRTTRFVKGGPATPNGTSTPRKKSVVRKTAVAKTTASGRTKAANRATVSSKTTSKTNAKTASKRQGTPTVDAQFGPSWTALEKDNARKRRKRNAQTTFMGSLSTVRFVLGVLAVAIVFTLYVGHVYATQELVQEVERLSRQRLELDLEYNRVRGQFDRMTGHDDIWQRARDLGLREAVPTGERLEVR